MYNVRDMGWMLKSMLIHQSDSKWIIKSNFVTSCIAFKGSIPIVLTSYLKYLVSTKELGNLQVQNIYDCSGYKLAKFFVLPFNRSVYSSFIPFNLVHFDVGGLFPISTKGKYWYYVSFIDNYTSYYCFYFMRHCSYFFSIYNAF